jgi:Uncharacterized protein conserved in bacteria (DUF2059)
MKRIVSALALALAIAAPAIAQTAAPPPAPAAPAAPEPARVVSAKTVIDKLWPLGTYRRLMDGTMSKYMDSMMDQMYDMKASDIDPTVKGADANQSLGAVAAKGDPHFRERMQISMKVMFDEMIPLFDKIEPTLRESMIKIYARKFTGQQLDDLGAFLATPSGQVYGREWMTSFMDPEIMTGMQSFLPEFLKAMPGIQKKVEAATAHLPPPPKPKGRR